MRTKHDPKRNVDTELLAREHCVCVRPDREERRIAEIEQTRKADDDIESERE